MPHARSLRSLIDWLLLGKVKTASPNDDSRSSKTGAAGEEAEQREQPSLLPLLVSLYIPGFLLSLGLWLVAPFAAIYGKSFGVNYALASLVIGATAVGRVIMDVPAGIITDRLGRRRPVLAAPLTIAVASVAAGLTGSFWVLVACRLVEGMGLSVWDVARRTVIIDQVPREMRGRVISMYLAVNGLGMTAGPVIGAVIASSMGIRWAFFAYAIMAMVSFFGVLIFVKESKMGGGGGNPFHGLRQMIHGFPELGPMRVTFIVITAGFMVNTFRAASNNTLFPLFGSIELNLNNVQIGIALTVFAFVGILSRFPGGYVTDKYGRKRGIVPAQAITGVGTILMFFANDYNTALLILAATSAGQGLSAGTITAVVGDVAPASSRGSFIATQALLIDMAQGIGPLILGGLADIIGLRLPFLVVGLALLISAGSMQLFARETLTYRAEETNGKA